MLTFWPSQQSTLPHKLARNSGSYHARHFLLKTQQQKASLPLAIAIAPIETFTLCNGNSTTETSYTIFNVHKCVVVEVAVCYFTFYCFQETHFDSRATTVGLQIA